MIWVINPSCGSVSESLEVVTVRKRARLHGSGSVPCGSAAWLVSGIAAARDQSIVSMVGVSCSFAVAIGSHVFGGVALHEAWVGYINPLKRSSGLVSLKLSLIWRSIKRTLKSGAVCCLMELDGPKIAHGWFLGSVQVSVSIKFKMVRAWLAGKNTRHFVGSWILVSK